MFFTICNHNNEKRKDGFETIDIDFKDIPSYVMKNGYGSNSLKNGSRKINDDKTLPTGYEQYAGKENALILDVDDGLTIEMAKDLFKAYNAIIITTKKHQATISGKKYGDRFRIILEIEPINSFEDRKIIISELYKTYSFVDQACKSTNRFFFASPTNATVIINETGILFNTSKMLLNGRNRELLKGVEDNKKENVTRSIHRGVYVLSELTGLWTNSYGETLENDNELTTEHQLQGGTKLLESEFYSGNRNNAMFQTACMLLKDGIDEDTVTNFLIKENDERDSMNLNELMGCIKSAIRTI